MVKSFKESHAKDLEKLAADRQRQAERKATDDLVKTDVSHAVPYLQSSHVTGLSDDHQA